MEIRHLRKGDSSLPRDAAVAAPYELDQVQRFRRRNLARDAHQRLFQFQVGTVQIAVRLLENADLRRHVPGAFEPDQVQSAGLDFEPRASEKRRRIQVHPSIAAHHGEPADPGKLMHQDATGEERLIFNLRVAAQQHATGDDGLVADLAVVGDVPAGHDEIAVADLRNRFGRGAARDGEVLANLIAVADSQIAAGAVKVLVERVGAEHRARADLVPLAEGGPALDINVGIEHATGAQNYVPLDHAVFADSHPWADDSVGRDDGGGGNRGRRIDGHELV